MSTKRPPGGKWTASGPHQQVTIDLVWETRTGNIRGQMTGEFIGSRYLEAFVQALEDAGLSVTVRQDRPVGR